MLCWVQGLGWAAACAKPAFLQQCKESELGACSAAQVLREGWRGAGCGWRIARNVGWGSCLAQLLSCSANFPGWLRAVSSAALSNVCVSALGERGKDEECWQRPAGHGGRPWGKLGSGCLGF